MLLDELENLDQGDIRKIIKMIHFMKKDVLTSSKKNVKGKILSSAGILGDLTNDEADVYERAIKREIFLGRREIEL
ncbi:conserved hypothetical protein [Desulfamplus magnetovallimortis]|uniref:Uncharacterized protein n=2 Tax=Desulfamplus magnetovallimortis TaxID=1246637 RepID=A0A1W1H9W7_9BACT|nr:conserved hypothetical protein [Desulfamplus magnetovallimortis]